MRGIGKTPTTITTSAVTMTRYGFLSAPRVRSMCACSAKRVVDEPKHLGIFEVADEHARPPRGSGAPQTRTPSAVVHPRSRT